MYRPAKYTHTWPFQKSQVLSNNNSAPVSFPHYLHDFRDDFSNWHLSDSSVDKKIIIFLDKKELNISNRKLYIVSRKIVNPFGSWKTTLFWEKNKTKITFFFKQGRIILNIEIVFTIVLLSANESRSFKFIVHRWMKTLRSSEKWGKIG